MAETDLFNKKILEQRIEDYNIENMNKKIEKIKQWQSNLERMQGLNEVELQKAFLRAIFEDILGYEDAPMEESTLQVEPTSKIDASRPDAMLGFYSWDDEERIEDHRAVIELKGPQVSLLTDQKRKGTTYKSPVDQAFSYTNKFHGCQWYIVSNFDEIRLYKVGASKEHCEIFHLRELDDPDRFKKFHYILCKSNFISKEGKSHSLELTESSKKFHEDISVEFYNLYKNTRINLFEHLKENNKDIDPEILIEKAQKFLDRIIFICFCEDKGFLPNELLVQAIEHAKEGFIPSETAVWDEIKGVFRAVDKGYPDRNINAYDGGLFEHDEVLDELIIKNEFFDAIYDISNYDFDSELDVNILGHIFEQSISDIEKLKSNIKENEYDESESKRKKEGIYYTPQYITNYIVENAVGGYLEDIKEELGYYDLPDIEDAGSESWRTRYTKEHLDFYDEYEKELMDIKVLDPACGSGAFLNQAFDYLLNEHKWLNKQRDLIRNNVNNNNSGENGIQMSLTAQEQRYEEILKDNLYGVDLNEESVEITKLSLWLKTASQKEPLTNLDDNIKCGNSLIDNPKIAGNKAFDWEEEFQEIMNDGGFDVVIGNPPYVRTQNLPLHEKEFYNRFYKSAQFGSYDIYIIFVEKGLEILNQNGYLGYILPNKFFTSDYGEGLRTLLTKNKYISKIISFGDLQIFEDASTYTCLLFLNKNDKNSKFNFYEFKSESDIGNVDNQLSDINQTSYNNVKFGEIEYSFLESKGWILESEKSLNIFKKLDKSLKLKSYIEEIFQGIRTSANPIYVFKKFEEKSNTFEVFSEELNQNITLEKQFLRKAVKRNDLKRYILDYSRMLLYPYKKISKDKVKLIEEKKLKNKYPLSYNYLREVENKLRNRENKSFDDEKWYRYGRSQNIGKWDQQKIMIPDIVDRLTASLDVNNYINVAAGYAITLKDENKYKLITLILNSKLLDFYLRILASKLRGGYRGIYKNHLTKLPIKISERQNLFNKKFNNIYNAKNKLFKYHEKQFINFFKRYTSTKGKEIKRIISETKFSNKIYSGRARKVRDFTVNINANIVTLYSEKSGSGRYELLKFEEKDYYRKQYIKYYLESLTEEQLEEINDKHSGNLLKRVLQIEIPDYDKDNVVERVVDEWENLQQEIENLEDEIEKTDNEIDQMVYDLYDLTEEEIKIVEKNL